MLENCMTAILTYTSRAQLETITLTDNSPINSGKCAVAEILRCVRLVLFHSNFWSGFCYRLCVYCRYNVSSEMRFKFFEPKSCATEYERRNY